MQEEKLTHYLGLLALSLSIDFDKEDVKRNYFALAKLYHPNYKKVADDGLHYNKIKEAYHYVMKHYDTIKAQSLSAVHQAPVVYEGEGNLKQEAMVFKPLEKEEKRVKKRHFKPKSRIFTAKRVAQIAFVVLLFLLFYFVSQSLFMQD